MDAAQAGLIGAAAGALGAVLSQVVAQVIVGRRERRKNRDDLLEQRRLRFIDIKRDVFVRLVQVRDLYGRVCTELHAGNPDRGRRQVLEDRARQYGREILLIEREVELLAPSVAEEVRRLNDGVGSVMDIDGGEPRAYLEWSLLFYSATGAMLTTMSRHLLSP